MKKRKRKQQKKLVSSWMDSTYLLEFEEMLLGRTFLKNLPVLRKWRLRRELNKWNRGE
jgi:hypothetical protein